MTGLFHVYKSFGDHRVFADETHLLREDGVYCLMGPSGSGKTTFLRLLAGLEKPDAGSVEGTAEKRIGMVFQEDRLCMGQPAVTNLKIASPEQSERSLREALACLLPEDCLNQPVRELSGGMRRRVSVARAVMFAGDILLMDEPFTGLDGKMRRQTVEFILGRRAGRLLIVSTHQEEDAGLLGAEVIEIS